MDDDLRDLVFGVARKRMATSQLFDRWVRAFEEKVPDETAEERKARLTELHWELFDEAPPFDRSAERPKHQGELPLEGGRK